MSGSGHPLLSCAHSGRVTGMDVYEPVIGMEVHAELRTQTKMFCRSKNDPLATEPNVHVCPVCLAHPGTLPVINAEAVRAVLRVGVAIGGALADYTECDRKNYFYPDLPKGYQLSQYEHPLVSGGKLDGIAITRVHLEEDTASSLHNESAKTTLIDFNRAGVPLMELVTEPVIRSAEEAGHFGRELQLLLRYLGVSDAHMEKGQMRVEANISVSKNGQRGTKVEVKNLNSFNTMERAIRHEIRRQTERLQEGRPVLQEPRGWDDAKQSTFAQRTKEGSADYRYFPDPDLPSLLLSEVPGYDAVSLRDGLPELPEERRRRYAALGIKKEDAELYVSDQRFGGFLDSVVTEVANESVALASNYIANDLVKIIRDIETRDSVYLDKIPVSPAAFGKLIRLISERKVSSRGAKDILLLLCEGESDPEQIAKSKGLFQDIGEALAHTTIDTVLSAHPEVVADYRGGKQSALEFLLGQALRSLKGSGDPGVLRELLKQKLG